MIDPLSRSEDFARLRRYGHRVRHEAMTITGLPDPQLPRPRLAYALPRSFGPATQRNRARRRLRALCRERASAGRLSPGLYLITPRDSVVGMNHQQLSEAVDAAFEGISVP